MATKLKKMSKAEDKQLADSVRASAHQIWQAGLGAFAKAQEEGGRVFAKLVKEGTDLQKRTQKLAEGKVTGVSDTVTKMADSVSKQASGSWDKLEQVFEDRVSRALTSLGVPASQELKAMAQRVEKLSKLVEAYAVKKPAAAKKAAPKAAKAVKAVKAVKAKAPKAAAKKAAAPKAAAKKAAAPKAAAKKAAAPKAAPAKAARKVAARKTVAKKAAGAATVAAPAAAE